MSQYWKAVGAIAAIALSLSVVMIAWEPLSSGRHTDRGDVDLSLSDLMARLDSIEEAVRHIDASRQDPKSEHARVVASTLADLSRRLDGVEHALSELVNAEPLGPQPPADEAHEPRASDVPDDVNAILGSHASETGVSSWGEQTAAYVVDRYAQDPFFMEFGGELLTDCRQATCKLTWHLPAVDSLPPHEVDLMFSTAQYELATLPSVDGSALGKFEVEWNQTAGEPYVAIYFQQSGD
jgi:hypothetical protein